MRAYSCGESREYFSSIHAAVIAFDYHYFHLDLMKVQLFIISFLPLFRYNLQRSQVAQHVP